MDDEDRYVSIEGFRDYSPSFFSIEQFETIHEAFGAYAQYLELAHNFRRITDEEYKYRIDILDSIMVKIHSDEDSSSPN